jgi:WD40 repeat protein
MTNPHPSLIDILLLQREARDHRRPWLVEDFLAQFPHLHEEPEAVLDLIYNEIILREEIGQRPQLDDYLARFPALSEPLKLQFEVDQALTSEDLTVPTTQPEVESSLPTKQSLIGIEFLGELGHGAMGVVYRGWQTAARRLVAVKILDRNMPQARVRAETEAASRLRHPNIVQIFDVRSFEGKTALVLEFVDGGTLAQKLANKPHPPREVALLIERLARAMAYAHSKGVTHRDLKPSNILLDAQPNAPLSKCYPKIGDFGLAKLDDGEGLTATHDILGTPGYMAPEQTGVGNQPIGPAADVWSLGAILYECLTGQPPFTSESVLLTLEMVRLRDPVPPSKLQPNIPRDLEIITLRCLQKTPARRYLSMDELADDLQRFLADEPIRARAVGARERAWKWVRRHPAVTSFFILSVALMLGVMISGFVVNGMLRHERDLAQAKAVELDQQLRQTRTLLYTTQLLRVGSIWENDPLQGLRMLEDPLACPADLRCPSWGLLYGQCRRYRSSSVLTGKRTNSIVWTTLGPVTSDEEGRLLLHPAGRVLRETGGPATLAVSVDGKTIAIGSEAGVVELFDVVTSQVVSRFEVGAKITAVVWHPDGRSLVLTQVERSRTNKITLWDSKTQRLRRALKGDVHPFSRGVVSPDGNVLAAGSLDHKILLWDLRTGKLFSSLRGHTGPVGALWFGPDDRTLFTGSHDGTVRRWDPAQESERDVLEVGSGPITALALHPDGQTLGVATAGNFDVQFWDLLSRRSSEPLRGHPGGASALTFDPRGSTLATVGLDGTLKLWDFPRPRERVPLRGYPVNNVAARQAFVFAPKVGLFGWLSRDDRREITLFDLHKGVVVATMRGHARSVHAMTLSEDGRTLISVAGNPEEPIEVLVWEIASGRLLQSMSGGGTSAVEVSYHQPTQTIATISSSGTLRLWDQAKGKLRLQLDTKIANPTALAWTFRGEILLAGGDKHGIVQCRQAITGELLWQAELQKPIRRLSTAHTGTIALAMSDRVILLDDRGDPISAIAAGMSEVYTLGFSHDASTLAIAGNSPTVKLCDVVTGQERLSLPRHRSGACFVGWGADDRYLLSATPTEAHLWTCRSISVDQ